jgi:uncharacterized protein YihD (DUF1040 family)
MTLDEMIRIAQEAGFTEGDFASFTDLIVHFGMLVATAEREACAKVCEEPGWNAANWCAKQIRARGNNA